MALSLNAQIGAGRRGAASRRQSVMAPLRAPTSAAAISRAADWAPSCPLALPRGRRVVARAGDTATPVVKIDNMHDAFATIVKVDIGGAGAARHGLGPQEPWPQHPQGQGGWRHERVLHHRVGDQRDGHQVCAAGGDPRHRHAVAEGDVPGFLGVVQHRCAHGQHV
uniref:Uncharacterized protein n=1 Tax=Chlamydomonas sp. HS-5 TaxID=108458 RepID=Q9XFV4_9CHLO|nr:hypothetical protein [Chlamydomonas sp. HS-5]